MSAARQDLQSRAAAHRFVTTTLALLLASSASAGRGGPDPGGWSWADSDEPGVDISHETPTMATIVASWPDESVVAVPLSFPVTLYGVTSSTVWLSSNGWLSLVDPFGVAAPGNTPLPSTLRPDALLAYIWDDLSGGLAQHGSSPTAEVFLIRHLRKPSGDIVQVWIQFTRDGVIKVVYLNGADTSSATVGIESELGSVGTELAYNGSYDPGFTGVRGGGYAVVYHPASTPACAVATPIACGATVTASTIGGGAGARRYGCSGFDYDGHDLVYALTVPALANVTATVSGMGARDLDAFVLRPGCDGYVDCAAGGADIAGPVLLGPGTHYIAVDGKTAADDGGFTLSVDCVDPTTPIACGATVADSLAGSGSIDSYSCYAADHSGPEKVYRFTVPAAQMAITANLVPAAPFDVLLVDPASLTPGRSGCVRGANADLGFISPAPGDYYLVVDGGAGASGAYTLSLACTALPTIPIDCGMTDVRGSNAGPSLIDTYPSCGLGRRRLGEAFYDFHPTRRSIVDATATDAGYDVFLFPEGDLPDGCLASARSRLRLANVVPGDYVFDLDSDTLSGATGLTLGCVDMPFVPIACDTTVAGRTGVASGLDAYTCLGGAMTGAEAFFVLDNPTGLPFAVGITGAPAAVTPGVVAFDVATSAGPFNAAAPPCTSGGNRAARIEPAPAGSYLIAVDALAGVNNMPFDLTVRCGTSTVSCAATPIACGDRVAGDTATDTDAAWSYGTVDGLYSGPEHVYRFRAPATLSGISFRLTAADPRLDLILLSGCDPDAVVASADDQIDLRMLPPGDYSLVVDGREGVSSSYSLEIVCSLLDCATPIELSCSSPIVGDTTTAIDNAFYYGCTNDVYDGGELVYHFSNPTLQTVSFLYSGPPELTLLLLPAGCSPSGCLDYEDGRRLIARNLDPGDYYLVVDARGGAGGAFEITPICDNRIDPPAGSWVLNPGEVQHVIAESTFSSCDPPRGDVVFSMDTTGSMGGPITNLKITAQNVINELTLLAPDVHFALTSFKDTSGTFTTCGYTGSYGSGADSPYVRGLPLGNDLVTLFAAIDSLSAGGGGDGPESYVRALYELYADSSWVGWRSGSRRLAIIFGDNQPHACQTDLCGTPRSSTGIDPGRDGVAPSADDLDVVAVMAQLRTREITPIFLVTGSGVGSAPEQEWDCLTRMADGAAYVSADGSAPPRLAKDIVEVIESKTLWCDRLEVIVTPGFELWVTNVTPAMVLTGVSLPGVFTWEFDISPPPGTPPGSYDFTVAIVCDADCSLTHAVHVVVPRPCVAPPVAATLPAGPVCAGESARLDGSPSTGCASSTFLYRWREGATVLCDWSPTPACDVAPPTGTTYILEVACADEPDCLTSSTTTVDVVPIPVAALAPLASICAGAAINLDASASDPGTCPVPLEYRFLDGATVLRSWATSPTFGPLTPPTSTTYTVEARCTAVPGCTTTASTPIEVIPFPVAALAPLASICVGEMTNLDASASDPGTCPVPLEYRFLDGATVLRSWSTSPTFGPLTPPTSTTYTVEARCTAVPGCAATASAPIDVVPLPIAAAGPDVTVCESVPVTLDGGGSTDAGCPSGLVYEWRRGATVVRVEGPDPTYLPPTSPPGVSTYTVVARCAGSPACEAADTVDVTIRSCALAVHFDWTRAAWLGGAKTGEPATVEVSWRTSAESGTVAFAIERAKTADAATFVPVGDPVGATGAGSSYRLLDPGAEPGSRPWYRILELTVDGDGDLSPPFQVAAPATSTEGGQSPSGRDRRGRGRAR